MSQSSATVHRQSPTAKLAHATNQIDTNAAAQTSPKRSNSTQHTPSLHRSNIGSTRACFEEKREKNKKKTKKNTHLRKRRQVQLPKFHGWAHAQRKSVCLYVKKNPRQSVKEASQKVELATVKFVIRPSVQTNVFRGSQQQHQHLESSI